MALPLSLFSTNSATSGSVPVRVPRGTLTHPVVGFIRVTTTPSDVPTVRCALLRSKGCTACAAAQSEEPMFPQTAQRIVKDVIVGESAAIRHVCEQADQVAATDSTVLLLGETGTGKELFAARIHEASGRRTRPMVSTNVGAIP